VRTDDHIYDENKKLKKELIRVTQERDLLKKGLCCMNRFLTIIRFS
jgi:hypothetical protein